MLLPARRIENDLQKTAQSFAKPIKKKEECLEDSWDYLIYGHKKGAELSLLYQRHWHTQPQISEPTPRS